MKEIVCKITEDFDETGIFENLPKKLTLKSEGCQNVSECYYDTFDWRLFNMNLSFVYSQNSLEMRRIKSAETVFSFAAKRAGKRYFANSFRSAEVTNYFNPILQYRAMTEICKCEVIRKQYRILNRDEKTVMILILDEPVISNDVDKIDGCKLLRLRSLKGYNKELKSVVKLIEEKHEWQRESSYISFLLNKLGRKPGAYSSKIKVKLNQQDPLANATSLLLENLFYIINECKDGIIKDIDVEFLHDYRVSIRKARVLLSELKKVFSADVQDGLKNLLKEVGQRTNAVRDLDVYLLKKSTYESYLPVKLKKALTPLFVEIKKERQREFRKLKKYLQSAEYGNILEILSRMLEESKTSELTKMGKENVLEVSRQIIFRRYKSILKRGRKITVKTDDQILHDLRLEGKKLRYLLELFASLYPKKEVDFLISQLKLLQDNLGEFNDLCVQQNKLFDYLKKLPKKTNHVELASVIGGLITSLNKRQYEVRQDFFSTFEKFDSSENKKVIKRLFQPEGEES